MFEGIGLQLRGNKEALEAIRELDALEEFFKEDFTASLGYAEIKQELRSSIVKFAVRVQTEIKSGRSARDVCLGAMLTLLRRDLSSGHDHTYRGFLSLIGDAKLALWDACFRELVKMGASTDEIWRARRDELDWEIKQVG